MTHVVRIDILTGHEKKGYLHFYSADFLVIAYLSENYAFFSKLVQLIMKV